MKKKLLLIALPALMVLSGCANIQTEQPKVEQEQPAVEFKEDTVAHEEIFGEAVEAKQLAIRKMDVVDTESLYKVGYQIHFDNNKTPGDTSDDTISIRFIAAINADYSSMVWSRGFTTDEGDDKLTFSDRSSDKSDPDPEKWYPQLKSTVVYSTLSNGGEDAMEAGVAPYASYTGFIVYSLTGIQYETYKQSYLGVSLTLTPALGDAIHTDFYAVKIEKNAGGTASADTFSCAYDKSGFFLVGTVNNTPGLFDADASTKGDNAASFTRDVQNDDHFIAVQKTSSVFKVWSGNAVKDTTNFENDGGKIRAKTTGLFVLYLNTSNQIWPSTPYRQLTSYYFRGAAGGGWGNDTGDIGIADQYRFVTDPDNKAVLLGVTLTVGDFKIGDQNWSHEWGYFHCKDGGDNFYPNNGHDYETIIIGGAAGNFDHEEGKTWGVCNIHCKVAGTYNIYLTNNFFVSIELAA